MAHLVVGNLEASFYRPHAAGLALARRRTGAGCPAGSAFERGQPLVVDVGEDPPVALSPRRQVELGEDRAHAGSTVWGGSAGRFTATAVTALDAQARVQVNASARTDLVIDVVGYYR